LTQEELAERAGISLRGVAALETGERLRPRRDTVQLLADALHLADETRLHFEAVARGREDDEPAGSSPPPLVGRAAELELLEWHLEGQGPIVLTFAGEPGIGKTRLLRQAAKQAVHKGQVVVSGGCQRRSGQEPYAPFARALARYLALLPADTRKEAVRDSPWLGRLLPELAPSLPEPMVSSWLASTQERRLLFDSVVRLFVHLARPTGALLLLDDLQWAPTDALDLLTALVQDLSITHLRVVCAYRSTEARATDPLAMMLADLTHAGLARQRIVQALSPQESEQLLMSLFGACHQERGGVQRAVRRTGGVPFYVVSYAQELETKGMTLTGDVPWSVAHSLRQRAVALPPLSQDILRVAAVAGRVVPWVLLTSVIGRPDGELMAGLEAGCASRLLEEAGGDAYQFPHDVIREVIEADLGSVRRKLLHRRIAEALERLPERDKRVAELAWHFLESQDPERALPYAVLAGDQAEATFAHGEAEEHYRTALDIARKLGDRPEEGKVLEKLGRVLKIAARYDDAIVVLDQAAGHTESPEALERIMATIGQTHLERGTPEDGLKAVGACLGHAGSTTPSLGRILLYTVQSDLLNQIGSPGESLDFAEQASDLLRRSGPGSEQTQTLAGVELRRGRALLGLNRSDEGRQALEAAIHLAELAGDMELVNRGRNNLYHMHLRTGELARAAQCNEQALSAIEPVGEPLGTGITLSHRGHILLLLGDWAGARTHFERAGDMLRSIGPSRFSANPSLDMGQLLFLEGDWERARKHLDEGIAIAEGSQRNSALWGNLQGAVRARAELDMLVGQPQEALLRLQAFFATATWYRPDEAEANAVSLLPTLASAHLQLGNEGRAQELLTCAISRANDDGSRLVLADLLRVQGVLLARRKRIGEAEERLQQAISMAASMPYPYLEARSLYELGRALAEAGRSEQARERLQSALSTFRRLGARKDIERTGQALVPYSADTGDGWLDGAVVPAGLDAAGRRPTRLRSTWPASLTDREVEVLMLIATGTSYREVARELGISPKTVRPHIEHVYNKIGVSTRAEAAIFAVEHGLVPR
jgi:tetratricopeptide (TPR) repeat protein/DNA-binding CsgD family transcriptional regulator/transcriptional regulator with XRE-family HTH domain